ncbi:MAG: AraC family transcriptional regulator [Nevskia sp.]|nr:AraC family transcriptional regulator [Nevskia sp.]
MPSMTATTKKKTDRSSRNTLRVTYSRLFLELARERGIHAEVLLAGTGLQPAAFDRPDLWISSRQAARMVHNAMAVPGNDALGIEYGLRMRATAHGFLGYAVLSCDRLVDAIDLTIKYFRLRTHDVGLNLSMVDGAAVLEAHEIRSLGSLRRFYLECLMIGVAALIWSELGLQRLDFELWLDWDEPPYFAPYRERLPGVRFGMPSVQLRIPGAYLQRPLAMADRLAAKQAVEQCERELMEAGMEAVDVVPRVRAALRAGPEGYPGIDAVAAGLFMSTRTLKRRLHASGASFRDLLNETRHKEALRLMQNSNLELQQIAERLGFSNPAAFTRAFRRWTGRPPSAAREAD